MTVPEHERLSAAYRRFAEEEARGRSPLYEALARGIADDPAVLFFLETLPRAKRQPNLLLAAVRFLFGTPSGWEEFRAAVLDNEAVVHAVMLARSTQTNEPGRCAALLPVLAMLPQPLTLIEVGASAGLCLLPDHYGYDYSGHGLRPPDEAAPVFPCAAGPATPLPDRLPQIAWRAGLDLSPIDIADPDQAAWLRALVWPEQEERLARLEAAMRIAARYKPLLVQGDLRHDLARLAAEAPRGMTRVVFHTAVLAYVADAGKRAAFARSVLSECDFWISNEAPHVFPDIAAHAAPEASHDEPYAAAGAGRFLMAVNGSPVAWADPHGASLAWIADPPLVR